MKLFDPLAELGVAGGVLGIDVDQWPHPAGFNELPLQDGGCASICPRKVEAVRLERPGVVEASVVGAPDPPWGEKVLALVVTTGHGVSDAQLGALCWPAWRASSGPSSACAWAAWTACSVMPDSFAPSEPADRGGKEGSCAEYCCFVQYLSHPRRAPCATPASPTSASSTTRGPTVCRAGCTASGPGSKTSGARPSRVRSNRHESPFRL